jgi:hypothetical protein
MTWKLLFRVLRGTIRASSLSTPIALSVGGVTIFGVRGDEIAWERLYLEPVQERGRREDSANSWGGTS